MMSRYLLTFIFLLPFFDIHAQTLERLDQAVIVKRSVNLMSTQVEFAIVSDKTTTANTAIDAAIIEIERVVNVMSEWRSDSLVSQVNTYAAKEPAPITRELFRLLEEAQTISELTQGKFDITFASAGKLWDFRNAIIPSHDKILAAIAPINYQFLELNEEALTAFIRNQKTQIGLGGIAKGYAVDRAVAIIRQYGFKEFSVNAGGDLFAEGQHQNKLWQIGIQNPRNASDIIAVLPVANAAVATSGDYERYFIKDGVRYSHILDPDTGYPARLCQSVTILAPRTYLADALATGVFVMGPQKGMDLVNRLPDIEAVIIDAEGKITVSRGLPDLSHSP